MAQGVGIPGALAQLSGRVAGPSAASVATGAGVTSEPHPPPPRVSVQVPRDPQHCFLGLW